MTATPTVQLNALANAIEVVVTNSDSAINQIWRRADDEANPTCLTRTLQTDGTFTDYGVASGRLYSYFARAVLSGVEADSVVHSLAITLDECWLHALDKTQASTQLIGDPLILQNLPGQQRGPQRQVVIYRCAGREAPLVLLGRTTEQSLQLIGRFSADDDVEVLQELFDTKRYLCVRDQKGLRLFAVLRELPLSYEATFTDVTIVLVEADYSEHVE